MLEIKNNLLIMNGKSIGRIDKDCLIMRRNTTKHFYRVLDAWCLNIEVVNAGVRRFIIETEQKERWVISFDTIKALRSHLNLFVTFGQERQLAIPALCWDRYSHENLSFPVFIGTPPAEFAEACPGRWRSRLIAHSQTEIAF